jgi:hypothetical protein
MVLAALGVGGVVGFVAPMLMPAPTDKIKADRTGAANAKAIATDPAAALAMAGKRGVEAAAVEVFDGRTVHAGTVPGTVFKDCPACPEMVVLPILGPVADSASSDFAGALSTPIAISRFELSEREWAFAVDAKPSAQSTTWSGGGARVALGEFEKPMQGLDKSEAIGVAAALSQKTGQIYRLPTRAEWRFAAAAGDPAIWRGVLSPDFACKSANLADASTTFPDRSLTCNDRSGESTTPVGAFVANRFGIADIFGNVLEWVEDSGDAMGGSFASGLKGEWLERFYDDRNRSPPETTFFGNNGAPRYHASPALFGLRLVRVLPSAPATPTPSAE